MSKIQLLDELLSRYKLWTLKLRNASQCIEDNILQKDSSAKLEEKIISIGISSLLVYIGTSIVALFDIATDSIGVVALFIVGWLLSRYINKKVFGSERKIENIRDDERVLLHKLKEIEIKHKKIRDEMNSKTLVVNFTDYPNLRREFNEFVNLLLTYNSSALALKYRYKHSLVADKYKLQVRKFDEIYAHKQGR